MMGSTEEKLAYAQSLRDDKNVHYNCCQSVLCAWAEEAGLSRETVLALGRNMGAGMRVGSMCGAASGALLILGAMGYGEEESLELLKRFRERHGFLSCDELLNEQKARGAEKKPWCDAPVADAVRLVAEVTGK